MLRVIGIIVLALIFATIRFLIHASNDSFRYPIVITLLFIALIIKVDTFFNTNTRQDNESSIDEKPSQSMTFKDFVKSIKEQISSESNIKKWRCTRCNELNDSFFVTCSNCTAKRANSI